MRLLRENLEKVVNLDIREDEELSNFLMENLNKENINLVDRSFNKGIMSNITILNSNLEKNEFTDILFENCNFSNTCLLYTSPSPRDPKTSRMPSSA